jgi:putative transposase
LTESISKALDQSASWNKVELDFSPPGKPTDRVFIESFNDRVRQELLNASWFGTLDRAHEMTSVRRSEYNEHRRHRALGNASPKKFARAHATISSQAGNF